MSKSANFLDLSKLLRIREVLGPVYGSEDLCILLYSLVRRERPQTVVELGTGLGVSTLWMGQALRENGLGHVYAIDDSRQGPQLLTVLRKKKEALAGIVEIDERTTYQDYLQQVVRSCELTAQISCRQATMALTSDALLTAEGCDFGPHKVDLLFSDFDHGPDAIMDILTFFLPRMSECASIFIDSASTHLESFLMLENTVAALNQSKIPRRFLSVKSEKHRLELSQIVAERHFRLTHLIERKQRSQNSTAWLRIEPSDWRPHPTTPLH